MSVLLKFVSIILLITYCSGYYLCTGCFTENSTKFSCNGNRCDGYLWPTSTPPSDIVCKGTSSSNCYYNSGFSYSYKLYEFTACNWTMNNCATCYNQNSCDSCANGFLTYYTNLDT